MTVGVSGAVGVSVFRVGGAVAMLAAGVVVCMFGRRRRTRFVAES